MQTATLKIPGHCPSKKNHYRVAGNRLVKDDAVKTYEYKAVLLLRSQWSGKALTAPANISIDVDFHGPIPDDIGVAETIYDALQAGGVVANDAYLSLCGNPAVVRHHVRRRDEEGITVHLRWDEPGAVPGCGPQ